MNTNRAQLEAAIARELRTCTEGEQRQVLDEADRATLQGRIDASRMRWSTARSFALHVRRPPRFIATVPMGLYRSDQNAR